MTNQDFSRPPGILTRLSLALTGGNRDRAAWAGRDDQARFRLLGLALVLLFVWITFNVQTSLQQGTGDPGVRPWALAALIAGMYVCVDIALMQANLWSRGQKLAWDRGFGNPPHWLRQLGVWCAGLPAGLARLALSVAVAWFTAQSFMIWVRATDIETQLAAEAAAANVPLRDRIEASLNAELAVIDGQIAAREAEVAARATALAEAHALAAANAAALAMADRAELDALGARLAALDEQIACAERNVRAEEFGLVDCAGVERVAGKDTRYLEAMAELDRLTADRAAVEASQTDVAERLSGTESAVTLTPTGPDRLLDDFRMARQALVDGWPARVEALMRADPAFVPVATGPIARERALGRLAEGEPLIAAQIWAAKAMFVLLDIAMLAIVFGTAAASAYSLRQVVEFEARAADEIATGCEVIAMAQARQVQAEAALLQAKLTLARAEHDFAAEIARMEAVGQLLRDRHDAVRAAAAETAPVRYDA
jgi:hypothetical protein